jgi:hypothetical protein
MGMSTEKGAFVSWRNIPIAATTLAILQLGEVEGWRDGLGEA